MALAKKRYIEQSKVRVHEKLATIEQEWEGIVQYVGNQIDQAKVSAGLLLKINDRPQFIDRFRPTMLQLEECLNTLFLIQALLPADDSEDKETPEEDPPPSVQPVNQTTSAVKPVEPANVTSGATKPSVAGDVLPAECKVSSQNVPETSAFVVSAETKVDVPQSVETRKEVTTDATNVDSSDAAHHIDTSVEVAPSSVLPQTAPDETPQRQTDTPTSVSAQTARNIPDDTPLKTTNAPSSVSAQTPNITLDETPQNPNALTSLSSQTGPDETTASDVPAPHQGAALAVSPLTLHEGVNLDVIVTEVISPSLFWVQPLSSKLTDMMSDLISYHSSLRPADAGYHPVSEPTPGMLVCARFTCDDNWYRARITAVHIDSATGSSWHVDVIFIDYGNRERTTLERIRPLPVDFTTLPCHAFSCGLAQVGPPDGSTTWQPEACVEFMRMILNVPLCARFSPPLDDCPLYLVELFHLNPSEGTPTAMTSVGEMLFVEHRAMGCSRGAVVQAFTEITGRGVPSENTLSETVVHRFQAPKFMCHEKVTTGVDEKPKTSPDDDCGAVVTTKKAAPLKGKERNRAVRESLRKRKEAKKMVTPPSGVTQERSSSVSVTSADDDGLSEVMGSSADQLLDDYGTGVGGSTESSDPMTVQQEAPRGHAAVQRGSSHRRDNVTPAERFATSRPNPSPEPAGSNNAAWHAYWRNKGSQGRDDHNRPRDGGQRSEEQTRRDSCGDNRDNRSDSGNQWKEERERNTRRDSFGDNRGNRSDSGNQWKDVRVKDTQRDTQNWVDNRGNRSENGRDVIEEQTYDRDFRSSRGNRSDNAGDWTADLERYRRDSQDFRYKHGNERERGSERRSPREGREGRTGWRDGSGGYTDRYTRKEPQRQATGESRTPPSRSGFSRGNFRNDSEHQRTGNQSQSSARSAYHPPRSPEYQQNVARSPCGGGGFFNRNASTARRDSGGFGSKGAFDNTERRDVNHRSSYQPRKVKLDLGSNNRDEWDFFDEGPKTVSPRDRFEPRGCSGRRGFPKSPNAEIKNAVEELWDLEPVRETTPTKTKQETERATETTPSVKTSGDSAVGSACQESAEVAESGQLRSAGQGSATGPDVVPHKLKSAENVTQEVDKSESTGRSCPESVGEATKIGAPVTSGLKAVAQGEDTASVPGVEEREGGKTVELVKKTGSKSDGAKGDASEEGHGDDLKEADEDVAVLSETVDPQRDDARDEEMAAGQEKENFECGNVEEEAEKKSLVKAESAAEVDCEANGEPDQETVSGDERAMREKDDGKGDSMKRGDTENIESLMSSLSLVEVPKANDSGRDQKEDGQADVYSPPETGEGGARECPDAGSVYSPPSVSLTPDGSLTFMLSYVESPSRFWVHPVSEQSSNAIDKIMHNLNQCYKNANKLMLKKFFEGDDGDNALELNSICCAQFSQDNDFYRTEIVSVRYEVEEASPGGATVTEGGDSCQQSRKLAKVKVFYLDFGNSEWLSPKRVYPLPPMFTGLAPQAVCCRLVDLEPIAAVDSGVDGGEVVSDVTWSTEATDAFTELTGFDKQLYGYVTTGNEEALRPTNSRPLDMVVVDTSQKEDVIVNEELVRLGFAKFAGPVPGVKTQLHKKAPNEKTITGDTGFSDLPPDWNPLAEDYLSERNSYLVDIDDPGVATVGIKAEDDQTICHYFNARGGCWKGDNCRFEHIRMTDCVTDQRRAVYLRNDLECMVTLPRHDSWVAVELTAIYNPAHFYVSFPFGTKSVPETQDESVSDEGYEASNTMSLKSELLEQLMESLNEHYNQRSGFRDTDMTIYASGELVVARFSLDSRWYRARVINADPDVSLVKVFYVDFGNSEWLPEASLAQISPQFLHLPFQAVECFLPLVSAADDGEWSTEARSCFSELSEGKLLFAHILSTSSNNVICVELCDTEQGEDVNIGRVLVDTGFAKQPDSVRRHVCPVRPAPKLSSSSRRFIPG